MPIRFFFLFSQPSLLSICFFRETYISAMLFLSLVFVGFDMLLAVLPFSFSGTSFDAAQINLEFSQICAFVSRRAMHSFAASSIALRLMR